MSARRLRELLNGKGLTVAPGAYDGLTAKLIASAGFEAVYMTGSGTASTFGYPDYGLVTMTEMVANAARIAVAADLPVIADADTGYGNELNVVRTVHAYEGAGVAGIHIEDQGFPKRCGHLDDKRVIALDDYLAKIRAAVDARRDPNFVIIARTDSRAGAGLEEAVRRCRAALAAGADMAFLEAPRSDEEVRAIPGLVGGPCLLNVVHNGKTPPVDLKEVELAGYRLAILPGVLRSAVVGRCEQVLHDLREGRLAASQPAAPAGQGPRRLFERLGAAEWDRRRTRCHEASPAAAEAGSVGQS